MYHIHQNHLPRIQALIHQHMSTSLEYSHVCKLLRQVTSVAYKWA